MQLLGMPSICIYPSNIGLLVFVYMATVVVVERWSQIEMLVGLIVLIKVTFCYMVLLDASVSAV